MKHFSETQKRGVLVKYICGYPVKELSKQLGVHSTTLYRWLNIWKKDLPNYTLADLQIQDIGTIIIYAEDLRQQLTDSEQTLNIIHESKVFQAIPTNQRIEMALRLSEEYPASMLCKTFEISLSTFYYHKRLAIKVPERQYREDHLRTAIAEIFTESRGRFGSEKIRLQLKNRGVNVSKKRIIRLMEIMGLHSKSAEPPYYSPSNDRPLEDTYDVQIL